MILNAKVSQFSFSPSGEILWQEKLNNPLPGVAVAQLSRGATALKPLITVLEDALPEGSDPDAVKAHLQLWLQTKITEVLEPLAALEVPEGAAQKDDPVSRIAARMYQGMGIVQREALEDVIVVLDAEMRAELRAKNIRLGPILVFMPALKKPAAVRLKALLWAIAHEVTLPVSIPADGIVSVRIEDENPNHDFYRAIGYPIYGGRAVRIDMLDRVISCVYEHAEKGKFQARHEMAEWLGSSIEDLYKVLEDMGHTKIYDPADHLEEGTPIPDTDVPVVVSDIDVVKDVALESLQPVAGDLSAESVKDGDVKQDIKKPELATFRLKKGKAFKSKGAGKGGFKNRVKDDKAKTHKKKKPDLKRDKKPLGPRVISAEAKKSDDDSPFAILQQLKK